ncbi:hypothetical protein [Sulfuriroseicoccus oceanibius]|uniref:Uncharacterized protein n=1 Tax=Sulfuriroseicoccus oceanibius TaxID=2707525 RepID=A0A6B3LE29_9BACT|nr:hypothetical protein [Sulfuriroseicoccus oceanibius]QQL45113.1 hypothetical protein G3M56_000555 [Sulfuriroseicoccus oceanibius]
MMIRNYLMVAATLVLTLANAGAAASTLTGRDGLTSYRLEPVIDPVPESGYAAFTVKVSGVGADEPIEVMGQSSDYQYFRHRNEVEVNGSQKLQNASSPQLVVLPVRFNDHSDPYNRYQVGVKHRGEMLWDYGTARSSSGSIKPQAFSDKLVLDASKDLDQWHSFDPARLPADWRIFTGFEQVTLDSSEWQSLSAAVRYALLDYARSGGELEIVAAQDTSASLLGLGMIRGDQRSAGYGLGRVALVNEASFTGRSSGGVSAIEQGLPEVASRIQPSEPAGPLTVIGVVVLGALIGPFNLFAFTRNRRHRLFFTVPVIALGASLVFAAAIFVADGIGGSGHRVAVVSLDPDSARASVVQQQSSLCGALFGSSFSTEEPTMLFDHATMTESQGSGVKIFGGRSSGSTKLNEASGREFSGDWFRSREKQVQTVVSAVPSRNRLALVDGAGLAPQVAPASRTVVNTTGSTLNWVGFVDELGVPYMATASVEPGAKVTLQRCQLDAMRGEVRGLLRDHMTGAMTTGVLRNLVSGGRLLAFSQNAPELCIETLGSIDWETSPVVLLQPAIAE